MNSDPHESAAWRTFGMLDSDEASAFDEAMRHDPELRHAFREMERLAAAVAVTATVPIAPRAGQLERLHLRLGLNPRKHTNWLGISGWAVAASLALLLVIGRSSPSPSPARPVEAVQASGTVRTPDTGADEAGKAMASSEPETNIPNSSVDPEVSVIEEQATDGKAQVKVETRRLIQEIEVLREKLETFQQRDRKRFEPTPGMAWPIVMRMLPPGKSGEITADPASGDVEPTITAMLGDALAASSVTPPSLAQRVGRFSEATPSKSDASAIPIYDPARGQGTLVVENLPAKAEDEIYDLWVATEENGDPIYVGRLPEFNNMGGTSFDFSLGSGGIIPTSFVLTKDKQGQPVVPSILNTVLQGPN